MASDRQGTLGDESSGMPTGTALERVAGPTKGEFVPPPDVPDRDEPGDALPEQEEFWRPPVRFGSVPVEANPLGWDRRRGFRRLYPQVMLPTQVVERVSFGHPELEPNRLFWGDNLHVMRQLPSESINLIVAASHPTPDLNAYLDSMDRCANAHAPLRPRLHCRVHRRPQSPY